MSDIVVSVDVRERTGTGGARAARREGRVPGVLYGGTRGPVAISVKANELRKAINTGKLIAQMVDLEHKGERQPVIARDIQFHPVTDEPVHIDFYRVEENSVITLNVPVHFINDEKSPGLKRGGVLNVVRHDVEVRCKAGNIPSEITVDLTGYEIGDSIHISAVTLPDGVKPVITNRDFTLATVQGSRAGVEEATSVEADGEDADGEETEVTEEGGEE
ncbi:MAG: 50S ribosomal protein L25/general stress protein Ctc [Oceanicaulis sp.]|uniref:50S ribosomal protein L25/general stress protein Ctc n=1 Tax=Glycocaulis sp. TaxID=1969725 RepID=UPI0025B80E64|nr:50S ribosomal protein L25/general stress protein Ctc [Glycocaulis sp.]MCC5981071.1 50S ribosomal protein L25/general stress protein Ctc [Oceanicaulis sp.]MCH8522664.1 50S ribosomal protein L25/general stress protein Ctc [Glycocaulis sp.]